MTERRRGEKRSIIIQYLFMPIQVHREAGPYPEKRNGLSKYKQGWRDGNEAFVFRDSERESKSE